MEESINYELHLRKGKYKHFKGGTYEIIDAVYDSETCEPMVLYRSLETKKYWFRKISDFFSTVNLDDYKGPRFIEIQE